MFLLIVFVIVLPSLAEGAIFYVGKHGSDFHSCIQAQLPVTPRLTIRGGLSCITGGDTLIIQSGVYAEFIGHDQVANGSSWVRATIIKAERPGTVTLQPLVGGGAGDAIWLHGARYVVIDGLVVDARSVKVQGIRINNKRSVTSEYIKLINLEVRNARNNNCIGLMGSFVEVLHSKIHDCGTNHRHHGVYVQGSNNVIQGNEIYSLSGYGVHIYHKNSSSNNNNTIRDNFIHDNGDRGILIGSGSDNIAHHNILRNNGKRSGEGGIAVGYNEAINNQVVSNVIQSNSGSCIRILRTSKAARIENNVCIGNDRDEVKDLGIGSLTADSPGTNTP